MSLKKLIGGILSKIKGEKYSLDASIPSGYLLMLLYKRAAMVIRGTFCFVKKKGFLFVGYGVTLEARSLISCGKAVTIDDMCLINAVSKEGVILGNNVSLGKRTVIECSGSLKHIGEGIRVGNNVGLGRDCFYGCAGGIEIGDNTIIGNFVSFHSENHNFSDRNSPIRLQGVTHKGIRIGEDCWIGAKATILDGAVIEKGCIISAGAVVTTGIYEAFGIYGGIPARLLKKRP